MRGLVSNTSAVEAPHKNVNLELRPYIGGCSAHARYSVGERGRGHRDRGLPEQMLDQLVAKPSVHLLIALVAWSTNLASQQTAIGCSPKLQWVGGVRYGKRTRETA